MERATEMLCFLSCFPGCRFGGGGEMTRNEWMDDENGKMNDVILASVSLLCLALRIRITLRNVTSGFIRPVDRAA